MISDILFGLMGLAVLILIAFIFSSNKNSVNWKQVSIGIGMQIIFAVFARNFSIN